MRPTIELVSGFGSAPRLAGFPRTNGANYDFDNLGRLTTVTPTGGSQIDFTYDGLDRIATRNTDTFTYNGAAIDPTTAGDETYGRTPAGNATSITDGTNPTIAIRDRHGDLVATIDPTTGTLASTQLYDPFGEPADSTGTTPAPGYQADYTDPDTGDVWMGARWYDPTNADDQW